MIGQLSEYQAAYSHLEVNRRAANVSVALSSLAEAVPDHTERIALLEDELADMVERLHQIINRRSVNR